MARNLGYDGRNIRGQGGDRLIIDEAGFTKESVLEEAVYAIIAASSHAEIIQISTPNGLNHFWKSYQRGVPGSLEIQSFHMPSWGNPFLPRRYLREQKLKRSSLAWRVEYGAEFVDEQNAVFPWSVIEAALDETLIIPISPEDRHRYTIGYDPAESHDRSALVTLDATALPWPFVDVRDIAGQGWAIQQEQVERQAELYNKAQVLMDATSVGDPIFQALKGAKLNVAGLKFTNQSKRELIDGFALELEQGNLRLPYHDDFLSELKFYRRDVSAAGTVTLGAAPGEHDDLVTAAARSAPSKESKARSYSRTD
jgi:phage FluMu gp28-like protein